MLLCNSEKKHFPLIVDDINIGKTGVPEILDPKT